ncbi:hypothetical protein F442_08741 [Phytophthora nicotianae P10297]|uniref:Uncharacterized protein n=3 Tax=Phytophthora nicotianae TaxID=4792 RepID=W2ZEY0_PHYNI|nr:hypothetical protein L916_08566 [Phytophthora nicotianae]ETL93364.1 hypothetical protein L917_08465 [Phytophthora nicotianae]ETM46623.1 hypothetical protein L914_08521 [Phytophthora nicotianae]ETO75562.1 hypothetical protein F444_08867 [Phytophthora nicotianae P1976]ETP44709.1 hypothetical protein F442_08741 [Phytophthora nicotianae P10297]
MPWCVARLEVIRKVRAAHLQTVKNSTPQKGGHAKVDDRMKLILPCVKIKESQLQRQAHKGGVGDEGNARLV